MLVSRSSEGVQGNGYSSFPSISADGRYVVFNSSSTNLVEGDTNFYSDVFVRDRWLGTTERVNINSEGTQANYESTLQRDAISNDGRYVLFVSWADNLALNDTNTIEDIFVHDRVTRQTTSVSIAPDGTSAAGELLGATISGNGRYVAFSSHATNLVISDTNDVPDVFVRDLQAGVTTRVSVASDGTQADNFARYPAISSDGRYITFDSTSANLVSDDTNGVDDVFLHDRMTGQTTRISVADAGTQGDSYSGNPNISGDGRYVAFLTKATNLVTNDSSNLCQVQDHLKLVLHDRVSGQNTCITSVLSDSQHGGRIGVPSLSETGRYITFDRWPASGPVGHRHDLQAWVHDRETGETTLISVADDGTPANQGVLTWQAISADGRYIAFDSLSDNLTDDDTNEASDVFVRDRGLTASHWLYLPITSHRSPG
jgi:Tol biopolymer transport system component